MNHPELLARIAQELCYREIDKFTMTERNIAQLLLLNGFFIRNIINGQSDTLELMPDVKSYLES